jgi:hypothetical protein
MTKLDAEAYRYSINREYANHFFDRWSGDRYKEFSPDSLELLREAFLLGFMLGHTIQVGASIEAEVKQREGQYNQLIKEIEI